jgi:alkanesulfonate monooxygenase SsuD/methylene tetrahydromethanopterin reductase-like flavin-dependent oxidoreductase (luciferase family)
MGRQTTYLALQVDGAGRHPGAGRRSDPARLLSPAHHVRIAATAARAGADLLALSDSFLIGDPAIPVLDAVAVAARVAPVVPGVGLVPTVTVTHTEPFHIAKAIATLDLVSAGRAGWEPAVSRTAAEAALFGRKPVAPAETLWREAAEAVEVVVRLWDSWDDDAVIRDAETGRYIDRDKLHYIDFRGEFFAVKGPSITPRSPQGHPLVVLRGDEPEAVAVAARWADVVRIAAPDVAAAHAARERVRAAVEAAGRDPDTVAVLLDVETLLAADVAAAGRDLDSLDGPEPLAPASLRVVDTPDALVALIGAAVRAGAVDGVTLVPLELAGGLEMIADEVAPRLLTAGLRAPAPAPAGATLRERFGLPRPANHFTGAP